MNNMYVHVIDAETQDIMWEFGAYSLQYAEALENGLNRIISSAAWRYYTTVGPLRKIDGEEAYSNHAQTKTLAKGDGAGYTGG